MQIIRNLDMQNTRTAVALGCFDGLHRGHKAVIEQVINQTRNGLVPCVLTFERTPNTTISGQYSEIMTLSQKASLLEAMGVEKLIALPFELIRKLDPRQFVENILEQSLGAYFVSCGFNYHFGANALGTADDLISLCAERNIRVNVAPPVMTDDEVISSTRIRILIQEGRMDMAEQLLGHPFTIDFKVVTGNKIGRLMGTPTINQPLPSGFISPKAGVYASSARVEGIDRPAVTNFGVKPTVGGSAPLFETWIPDYSGNLYHQYIEVSLYQFIRPEEKFVNIETLREQIMKDGVVAKQIFMGRLSDKFI